MRTSIQYLLSAVCLIIFLAGCAVQGNLLRSNAVLAASGSQLERSSPLAVLSDALGKGGYTLDWSRAESSVHDGLTATALPLVEVAGQVVIAERGGKVEMAQLALFTKNGQPLKDWPVCHRPPGNPANAHTIYVGYSAISAHVRNHGDTLGFCPDDMATNPNLAIKSVVLSPGNDPIYTKSTYNSAGEVVLLENGESLGAGSLTELLTLRPEPPQTPKDTAMRDFAAFLRETLGEEARPFLEAIPVSMGGTGPEIDLDADDKLTRSQVEICASSNNQGVHVQCGGGGSSGGNPNNSPKDPPSSSFVTRLLSVISGCGSNTIPEVPKDTPAGEATLSAAAGTLSYSDRIGASFMFVFNLDAPPPAEGFELSVFGPRGWNGGDPVRRVYRYTEAGRHATWVNIFRDSDGNSMEAVSGLYIVQVNIGGKAQRTEVEIDTSDLLPKPTLTTLEQTASSVSVSWEAVPGAASYLVELFETETGSLSEDVYLYKTALSATLEGLDLTVGGEYRVGVTALSVDFTENAAKNLPQGPFNTSFSSQRFIVVNE